MARIAFYPAPGINVSDADALVPDVKDPKTFYSVAAPRKTGTMPTVALNPAANAYPAGYHAGAASLTAVDGDLATGNIKDGITIFGVLGTLVAAGTETYEIESSGNLAQWATYTPSDPGIYFLASWVNYYCSYQYYSTVKTAWYYPVTYSGLHGTGISDGTNMRIRANSICEYILFRAYHSSGTYERYADQDLGAGASITPSDDGFFTFGSETNTAQGQVNYATQGWGLARNVAADVSAISALIGDSANIRVTAAGAGAIVVMRAIMS